MNEMVKNMDYCPKTELIVGGIGRGHVWGEGNVCTVCGGIPQDRYTHFTKELERLIDRFSQENGSDTPDFILTQYLLGCLSAWNDAVTARERWYGRSAKAMYATGLAAPEHVIEIDGDGKVSEPVKGPIRDGR
jgi:hypothetical protein